MTLLKLAQRFDGYLPIVIDLETSGVNPQQNALLEIAAISLAINENNQFCQGDSFVSHVLPFEGAVLDPVALEINRIQPFHPFRFAISEAEALNKLFAFAEAALKTHQCRRAVLVGHNGHFDLSFIRAAMKRCKIKTSPFHAFTCFDTATLAGVFYGKTILAKAMKVAELEFDKEKAHSALYDAERTAELFCQMLNRLALKPLESN
jgi:ribonuclease T